MSFDCPNVSNGYCRLMQSTCVPGKGICILKGHISRADKPEKTTKMMRVYMPNVTEKAAAESWGEWSKEPSEFPWYYDDKETCLILEGEAEVWDNNGNRIRFRAGDMVEFDQGLACTWRINKLIRKKFIFG